MQAACVLQSCLWCAPMGVSRAACLTQRLPGPTSWYQRSPRLPAGFAGCAQLRVRTIRGGAAKQLGMRGGEALSERVCL